ncbi:MAG: DNA-binding protein [Prevotella sp.]|nr:DNA-binding protein [Prevotella sp.]
MIRYKKYQNTNQKSTQFNKWYGRSYVSETLNTTALAEHMAKHNSPYSEGVIKGVLIDMIKCIKELVLDGKAVKLDDLAIFSCGITTSPADSASEFTAANNITGVKLRARATGRLSNANLNLDAQFKEYSEYSVDDEEEENT